jgi:RNA polymerase sigma-70 factor, ECF subfamily
VPRSAAVDALTRLALAARDGDEVSLAGFVRASQADVRRLAAHLVDPESADDVTQEVYLRAIPALARYRADAPARLWLLSIARRTCADVIRRRSRQRRLWHRLIEQPDPARVHGVAPGSGAVDLAELLDDLDPDRRSAFVLTQVLGLSYAEAAEVAGVPVGTIRSRVSRARGDLTAALAADEPEADEG